MKMMITGLSTLFLLLSTLTFNGFVVVKGEGEEAGFVIKVSVIYYNNGTENWIARATSLSGN